MAIYYVNGESFQSDELHFDTKWTPASAANPSEKASTIPVLDASAYVSAVVPIPDRSGFLMSRLFEDPGVIALDFKNGGQMTDTLARISYFVEINKKKQVPSVDELEKKLSKLGTSCKKKNGVWDDRPCGLGEGHDLKMGDVAYFYNECHQKGIELTQGEMELLNHLLENNFLIKDAKGEYQTLSEKVLIGMARAQNAHERRKIFVHEYSHAKFFLNPKFHKTVADTWFSLESGERRFLSGAMIASGWYDSGDESLLQTEAQAHAIGGSLSLNGFLNVLEYARKNCLYSGTESKTCNDFWSYKGDIKTFLRKLNKRYMDISECQIPLLANWKSASNLILADDVPPKCNQTECDQNEVVGNNVCSLIPEGLIELLGDPLDLDTVFRRAVEDEQARYKITPPRFILEGIQQAFDSRHRKK